MSLPKNAENLLCKIKEKIRNFKTSSDLTILNDKRKEEQILQSLENFASRFYNNPKAYQFGSRTFFLTLPGTDFDILLDCDGSYYKDYPAGTTSSSFSVILENLKSHDTNEWTVIKHVDQARVPFIKCLHISGMECDLTFGNGLAVEQSKLIR